MTLPAELLTQSFGALLKHWRSQRGWSQLELACQSEVSQRHISFLESGRSQPSRDMVLHLATQLAVPLRQQNVMLTAAGFAPLYSEHDLSAPELAPMQRAIDFMLHQQEPYPALVLDRYWNLLKANQGALRLMEWLLGDRLRTLGQPLNMMQLMIHPQGLRPYVENWPSMAVSLMQRFQQEAQSEGPHSPPAKLLHELKGDLPDGAMASATVATGGQWPVLPITFVKTDQRLSFFTIISTLGTPRDITLQELRVESLFPADAATTATLQNLGL
ncbi:helix-turn-helix transcriptional regulator [Nodosilinea sp. E11]|uniref:helix-turn-helix domain-containing protein n=1 Tax=Nodosilinea sp. E11 TaxID=3037479 RepID=UPI0029343011|nr:helix-turn-helix transcriptional regulator [Nodosilinea sp. E11]WOD39400.1 helix-turn-helix transcriptional regulator [Nodosilinea sp. E11]